MADATPDLAPSRCLHCNGVLDGRDPCGRCGRHPQPALARTWWTLHPRWQARERWLRAAAIVVLVGGWWLAVTDLPYEIEDRIGDRIRWIPILFALVAVGIWHAARGLRRRRPPAMMPVLLGLTATGPLLVWPFIYLGGPRPTPVQFAEAQAAFLATAGLLWALHRVLERAKRRGLEAPLPVEGLGPALAAPAPGPARQWMLGESTLREAAPPACLHCGGVLAAPDGSRLSHCPQCGRADHPALRRTFHSLDPRRVGRERWLRLALALVLFVLVGATIRSVHGFGPGLGWFFALPVAVFAALSQTAGKLTRHEPYLRPRVVVSWTALFFAAAILGALALG